MCNMKVLSLLGFKVMVKVKVFVHAAKANARAMTLAPRTFALAC